VKFWHALAVIFVLWAGIYLPGLGSEELTKEEPRRVLPGLEMLRTGDWVNLRVGGEEYHRKPPLLNWLIAYAVQTNDGEMEEWVVRLPSVLSVLLLLVGILLLVGRIGGVETGLVVSLLVLTASGMIAKGRMAEIEAVYIAMFGLAWLWWFSFTMTDRVPWRAWFGAGVLLGLGFLAKGPPHLLFFYLLVIAHVWAHRQWKVLLHPAHLMGVLVAVGVAAPWFVLSMGASAGGEATGVWMDQLTGRLRPGSIDWASWGLQFIEAILNFFPWCFLLVPLFFKRFRNWLGVDADDPVDRALRWGILVGYLAIAMIPTARSRYTMPLIVPGAVLVARSYLMARPISMRVVEEGWIISLRVLLVVVGVAAVIGPFLVPAGEILMAVAGSFLVVLVGYLLWQILPMAGRNMLGLALLSGALMSLIVIIYTVHVQGRGQEREKFRPVAERIALATREEAKTIVVYKLGYQPWTVYTWPRTVEISEWDDLPESGGFYLVLNEQEWARSRQRLYARYRHSEEKQVIENPWDGRRLYLVRIDRLD